MKFFTKRGLRPEVMSSTSYSTRIWPSVSGPAPMPITGTSSASVMRLPSSEGMHSSSTMSAPADSSARVLEHAPRRRVVTTLHAEAAGLVHRLWFEPQVRAHRDVVAREELDDLELADTAFQLDHFRAALLHEAHGIRQRDVRGRIARERQVGDQE